MDIKAFYDARTFTMTYVVYDAATRDAVIIDPVLDYDPAASKVWTESVDQVVEFARGLNLNVHYLLETHAHADHLSGSQLLRRLTRRPRWRSASVSPCAGDLQKVFGMADDFPPTAASSTGCSRRAKWWRPVP